MGPSYKGIFEIQLVYKLETSCVISLLLYVNALLNCALLGLQDFKKVVVKRLPAHKEVGLIK